MHPCAWRSATSSPLLPPRLNLSPAGLLPPSSWVAATLSPGPLGPIAPWLLKCHGLLGHAKALTVLTPRRTSIRSLPAAAAALAARRLAAADAQIILMLSKFTPWALHGAQHLSDRKRTVETENCCPQASSLYRVPTVSRYPYKDSKIFTTLLVPYTAPTLLPIEAPEPSSRLDSSDDGKKSGCESVAALLAELDSRLAPRASSLLTLAPPARRLPLSTLCSVNDSSKHFTVESILHVL